MLQRLGLVIEPLIALWAAVERRSATRCWSRAVSPIDLDPTCLCGVAENERDCPCSAADADVARALSALEAL